MSKFSIVVPTYRRPDLLEVTLPQMLTTSADEVVVVLDGYQRESLEVARRFSRDSRLMLVELEDNVGLAMARIAGLQRASGDYVVIVDDDVFVYSNLIEEHRRAHSSNGPRVVCVGYMPVKSPLVIERGQVATRLYAAEYEKTTRSWRGGEYSVPLSQLWNGNVSLERELYLEAEALKPSVNLPYNEDLDLGLRLAKRGATAVFWPEAKAVHLHARPLSSLASESEARGRGAAMLEDRWGYLPDEIRDLVERDYGRLQFVVEAILKYRVVYSSVCSMLGLATVGSGIGHLWSVEDILVRIRRRIGAAEAYRSTSRLLSSASIPDRR